LFAILPTDRTSLAPRETEANRSGRPRAARPITTRSSRSCRAPWPSAPEIRSRQRACPQRPHRPMRAAS